MILATLLVAAVSTSPVALANGPAFETRSLFAQAERPAQPAAEHQPGVDGLQALTAGVAMLPFDIATALVAGPGFFFAFVFGTTGMFAPISALVLTLSVGVVAIDMALRPFIGAAAAMSVRPGSFPLGLLTGLAAQAVAAALGAAIFWFPAAAVPLVLASIVTSLIAVPAAISFGINLEPPPPRQPATVTALASAPPAQVRFTF